MIAEIVKKQENTVKKALDKNTEKLFLLLKLKSKLTPSPDCEIHMSLNGFCYVKQSTFFWGKFMVHFFLKTEQILNNLKYGFEHSFDFETRSFNMDFFLSKP